MPSYEFSCQTCKCFFEISIDTKVNPSEIFCVDCGSLEVSLLNYHEDTTLRLTNLIHVLDDLNERVDRILGVLDESGSNSVDEENLDGLN